MLGRRAHLLVYRMASEDHLEGASAQWFFLSSTDQWRVFCFHENKIKRGRCMWELQS